MIGSIIGEDPRAVQAWVSYINAQGGLNCHRVKYIVEDDNSDPSRHQALVQQLVEQDKVVAFVEMNAGMTGQSSLNYLTQKRIPVIGSETASPWFYSSPMYFPQASTGDLLWQVALGASGELAHSLGKSRLGILSCVEAPICSRAGAVAPNYAPQYGMMLVYNGSGTLVQPDYTSQCQTAKQAGAQLLMMALDSNSIMRLASSCNTVSYHPVYMTAQSVAALDLASDPLLDGMGVGMNVRPWMDGSNAAIQEFQNALRQYAPGLRPDAATITGWVAAKLFQLAAQAISEPPTSDSVLNGLWSIKGNDLGGLTQPLTFIANQNAPQVVCYWLMQIQGGKFVTTNNAQRTCR